MSISFTSSVQKGTQLTNTRPMMVGEDLGRVIDLLLVKILNPMNLHKTYNG